MKKILLNSLGLARSSTAKDTYILFLGNVTTSFLGFLLIIILARSLSVEDMGVFSAYTNMVLILASLADFGISAGLVNFIAKYRKKKKFTLEARYIYAGFRIELVIFAALSLVILFFQAVVTKNLLATSDTSMVYALLAATFASIIWLFSTQVLRARLKFLQSVILDIAVTALRVIGAFILVLLAGLTTFSAAMAYALATFISGAAGVYILRSAVFNQIVKGDKYASLAKFSGWLGVNKIASVLAGKIDIQMLAVLSGAAATGLYSIPSRLIFFVTILVSSLSAVVAPRLSAFENKEKEKTYIIKILALTLLIVAGLVVWYALATPFIILLFGEKYTDSVAIFRLLIISIIPFVLTVPSVNAIIYSIRKPKFVGYFSILQLALIVALNLVFIPKYQALGPTYSLSIINTLLAVYSWAIVIKHYSKK